MSGDLTPGGSLLAYLHEQPPIPPITLDETTKVAAHVRRYAKGDGAIERELLEVLGLDPNRCRGAGWIYRRDRLFRCERCGVSLPAEGVDAADEAMLRHRGAA